jgi:hypothetical protein
MVVNALIFAALRRNPDTTQESRPNSTSPMYRRPRTFVHTTSKVDTHDIAKELTVREVKLNLGGSIHDPGDPMGKLLFTTLAMVAEFEADLARMRTREGMKGLHHPHRRNSCVLGSTAHPL